ncbi:MAG: hypothetical protein LC808_30760 [Actinobacteria bacterium]|nr:hypothetical protein [Actinomycetota bacterium]
MPSPSPTLAALRAKIARTQRVRGARHPDTIRVRQEYAEAQLTEYVKRIVSTAPPLSEEQRDRLASLLRPTKTPDAGKRMCATGDERAHVAEQARRDGAA